MGQIIRINNILFNLY